MFACAVVCLAGAIGTATAVFAIVNALVLRPLPFQHANRLVAIWGVNPARDTVKRGFSWPDTIDLSRATRSLDGVAALANAPAGMTLTGRGEPAQIPMWVVSGNFFEVLGVPPALGRTLGVEHDAPRSQPAVTSAVLAGSAAAALALMTSYVTARSAARIDPLTALRAE